MISSQGYSVADPDALETPAMLLFQDMMDHNIRGACEMVGGGGNLMTHVKTHKSEAVAQRQLELGIEGFKCATLKELEMVLRAGARRAILAYPQVQERKIERLCGLVSSFPDTWIATVVSAPRHLEMLTTVATRRQQSLRVMLDLDAGMHGTGIVAGCSFSFAYYARTEGMFGSPGTFIYWDMGFSTAMPDMPFRWAALILTQVVDRYPDAGTITTDLGYKGICSDLPVEERPFLLGHDAARLTHQSEEHRVFRIQGELPRVGDYLLAVPGHICPTTIRYPGVHVIDTDGNVVDYFEHTARDRL